MNASSLADGTVFDDSGNVRRWGLVRGSKSSKDMPLRVVPALLCLDCLYFLSTTMSLHNVTARVSIHQLPKLCSKIDPSLSKFSPGILVTTGQR